MIDIIEVAKRIKKKEQKIKVYGNREYTLEEKVKIVKRLDNKPTRVYGYRLPKFEVKTSDARGFNGSLKKQLEHVLEFIKVIEKRRYSKGCTLMPIACTNKRFIKIWGSRRNVVNGIKFMKELGLIECWLAKKKFNSSESFCYWYLYYADNEKKILDYCLENNISISNNNSDNNNKYNNDSSILLLEKCKNDLVDDLFVIYDKIGKIDDKKYLELIENINYSSYNNIDIGSILLLEKCKSLVDFNADKVRFSSSVRFKKPDTLSKEEFEWFLNACLHRNYEDFSMLEDKVKEINETNYRDNEDFKLKFEAKFTWAVDRKHKYEYVSKIGIRLYNDLCNVEKERRKEILKEIHYDKEKDVKSSVGRITYGLNTSVWLDESIDIYKLIYNELGLKYDWNEETRELVKSLFMRAYFDKSDKKLVKNIWDHMDQSYISVADIRDSVYKYKDTIIKVLGNKLYDSEIFYYESAIYLLVLYDLLRTGYKVWIVYDCFYCDDSKNHNLWRDEDTFEKLVEMQIRARFDSYYNKVFMTRKQRC